MTKTKFSVRRKQDEQERPFIEYVLGWINHPRSLEQRPAVQRLKQMLTALHGLRAKADRGEVIYADDVLPVNEYLATQKWITQLTPVEGGSFDFSNTPAPHDAPYGDMEYVAVAEVIVKLASKGKLERIQCCAECGRWFYSKRLGAHYDDDTCRKRAHDRTPAAKERRRRYDEACSVAAARKQLQRRRQNGKR
jgi:hypothetical protein